MRDQQFNYLTVRTCPICGKKFVPAPEHVYRVRGKKTNGLVCTYSCVLKSYRESNETKKGVKEND